VVRRAAGVPAKPEVQAETAPARPPVLFRMVGFLWESNVTPQSLVRSLGHFGPRLVKKAVDMRLRHIDATEREYIQQYLYHITVRRGSGEYALNTILSMSAWARKPLIHRLPGLRMPAAFLCTGARRSATPRLPACAHCAVPETALRCARARAQQTAATTGWTRAQRTRWRRGCRRAPRSTRSRAPGTTCTWRTPPTTIATLSTKC